MDDLIAFVTARLDEDEAAAKAAVGTRWRVVPADGEANVLNELNEYIVGHFPCDGGGATETDAAHIARHDPARVLREVEAGREILAKYEAVEAYWRDRQYSDDAWAALIARDVWKQAALALIPVYSDHPDYRPEWKSSAAV